MIDARQRRIGFLVAGCFFMEIMDGTIVSTAAPRLSEAFGVPVTSIGLVITAYFVTLAVSIPASGWLVSRWGTRKVFVSAIVLFTVASLLCSVSTGLWELVVFRVLQAVGGAMMTPVGRLAVLAGTAKSDLMRMISYIVWPALLAPVIAPLAGGLITTYVSWRWIFLINVPIGIVAFFVALRLIPAVPTGEPPPLDVLGAGLLGLGLGGLTYTADLVSRDETPWRLVAVVGVPAAALFALAIAHLLRAEHPLVDLRTLRIPTFRGAVGSGSLSGMAIGAVPFMLPLLFQNVFGWSAVKSGALVLFVFVGNVGIKPATSPVLNRWGFRRVLLVACVTLSLSLAAAAFITENTPLAVIILVAVVSGIARSVGGTSYNTLSFCDVPDDQMAHANAVSATAQQLAAGLGVAAATLALRLGGPLSSAVGSGTLQLRYSVAFAVLALIPLAAAVGVFRMRPGAGDTARKMPAAPEGAMADLVPRAEG